MSYRLRISEIFYSLQGESTLAGVPTVFIRLTGCPLRCGYCDTTYAFKGGEWMQAEEILEQVAQYHAAYVCVTGGEPLAQKDCLLLLQHLTEQGYQVSLETSGALDVSEVDEAVIKVVDIKTPDSGEQDKNLLTNFEYITDKDQLKFVICSKKDYEWSKEMLVEHDLADKCTVLFSPAEGALEPYQLADWILEDHLPVRMQLQLHKILWGGGAGR